MRSNVIKISLSCCLLWLPGVCPAALAETDLDTVSNISGVEISTSVDRSQSYIGDLISYTVDITYDSTMRLIPPPLGANLGAFEVKDYEPDIETVLDDGRRSSRTKFVLSTYTVGEYVIPPVPIQFLLPDSTRKIMLSESVPIKIHSLLEHSGDTTDIKPLKDPYEFVRDYTLYYLFGGVGLLLLIAAGVIWWYWRKRWSGQEEYVDTRPAWEIAFEKLAVLKEKKYIEDGAFKLFYVELTELTREFLGKVYEQDTLEMTTEEFEKAFSDLELPTLIYQPIITFMQHADLVKFAKHQPDRTRTEDDYLFTHELVNEIRDDYLRRKAELEAQAAAMAALPKPELVGAGPQEDNHESA